MLKILQLLKASKSIKTYTILDLKLGKTFYYIKIRAILINKDILHVREYVSTSENMYSYHWQRDSGELVCRWDNAPHYTHLKTFPHHKHALKEVKESVDTTLEDILKRIEKELK